MTKKNEIARRKAVLSMEYLARQINDEQIFMHWLTVGVADGDITLGNLTDLDEVDEYYIEPDNFSHLMQVFLVCMKYAINDGLYCGGIVSGDET